MSRLLEAIAGVPNPHEPVAGLVTGGQPGPGDLAALKAAGCEVLLDMRHPMEPRPYRAPDAVRAAGLEYRSLPVGHDPGDDATLETVRNALRELVGARPVFAHCGSGNRTGAALIPYLMLDRGLAEDDAVMEAMRMGTRSAALIEWALDYVRRHRG
jgi:protein tyrosine phosphatase (PTP) superfamily phosphohydrolase (DUF442 family)